MDSTCCCRPRNRRRGSPRPAGRFDEWKARENGKLGVQCGRARNLPSAWVGGKWLTLRYSTAVHAQIRETMNRQIDAPHDHAAMLAALVLFCACRSENRPPAGDSARTVATSAAAATATCSGDNGGLTPPAGFCAAGFADSIGPARHILVAPNRDHPMHPCAIDSSGQIYIDLGSASNACQLTNRVPNSAGHNPCTELRTRGGIWAYDANKTRQLFSPANRYATGIRNAVGIAIGPDGKLWSTQHGRDQLAENWSKLYTADQGQTLPAEELLSIDKDADFGWPRCYFDGDQQKLVLAPEYGGDGGKAVGDCGTKQAPAAFFPAHWAPDGLLFYTGTQFPARYRNGAFIAFHGSWNRAPGPQGGYQVVFQPLSSGKASGAYEPFADGFAACVMQPDAAKHRPVGLAQGPAGPLSITDDKAGRVWR